MSSRLEASMRHPLTFPPQGSMLILFDNGVPAPLRHALKGHVVVEAFERGWERFSNGRWQSGHNSTHRVSR
ncbi:hypothetical protein SBA2_20030 [Acidobacteriia bacterium SbA2]|nr:hypothetical protein SBA2_20030 [Acidobacteriia bacterium SbA2]